MLSQFLGNRATNLKRSFKNLLDHVHISRSELRLHNESLPRWWVVLLGVYLRPFLEMLLQLGNKYLYPAVSFRTP
jgi:hypothetical protein